jgi:hypothetical protein
MLEYVFSKSEILAGVELELAKRDYVWDPKKVFVRDDATDEFLQQYDQQLRSRGIIVQRGRMMWDHMHPSLKCPLQVCTLAIYGYRAPYPMLKATITKAYRVAKASGSCQVYGAVGCYYDCYLVRNELMKNILLTNQQFVELSDMIMKVCVCGSGKRGRGLASWRVAHNSKFPLIYVRRMCGQHRKWLGQAVETTWVLARVIAPSRPQSGIVDVIDELELIC